MIPIALQAGLKIRAEEIFAHTRFKKAVLGSDETVKLSVFEQNLPQKKEKDENFFPFLVVKMLDGEKKSVQSEHLVHIGFVIGVYDNDPEGNGYRDVVTIINKLFENISENPVIDGRFELSEPIKWKVHEEETDPYFFGVVETTWTVPSLTRRDVEALI